MGQQYGPADVGVDGVSLRLPPGAKPSVALSDDDLRPQLMVGQIVARTAAFGEGLALVVTDSYKAVVLRLEGEGEPGAISARALSAAEETGEFEAGEHIRLSDDPEILYKRPSVAPLPALDQQAWATPRNVVRVAVDAEFLLDVARALGEDNHGSVLLEFDADHLSADGYHVAIRVTPNGRTDAVAVLMPVRVIR